MAFYLLRQIRCWINRTPNCGTATMRKRSSRPDWPRDWRWAEVARILCDAIADRYPDSQELRVEQLRRLFTKPPQSAHGVAGVTGASHLGDPAVAVVRCRAAARRGCRVMELPPHRREKTAGEIPQALDLPGGLLPADRADAQGLLSDGSLPAIEHFRQTLRADPYHHRGTVTLIMELVLAGEFTQADRRIAVTRERYGPDGAWSSVNSSSPPCGAIWFNLSNTPRRSRNYCRTNRRRNGSISCWTGGMAIRQRQGRE